ncbi:MAG: hypothetical protein HKN21_08245 [Candidatus Eisenbacteria bacterium]|uniref:Uncharacterized protein n=1 Tax=Eiseniibacteriota bacterium TaxID=2212470 RepID=A0A7Y2E7R0_UNCEI|nr:hypothetical protein [Candidatus Eisenbacteria bacterium]
MLQKLGALDRRIIFVLIALAVIIPLAVGLVFPVATTPIVQNIFDSIEALPPGSKVLLTADYGPSTEPENQPMLEAVARHCLEKDLRLYVASIWATGPPMIEQMIGKVIRADFPDLVEGEDWCNLGFKAGNQGVINSAYSDFHNAFPTDARGQAAANIPMLAEVLRLENFDHIVAIGSGFPGVKEWVQFGGDPAGVPTAGGVTAVEAPLLYPYYPAQLLGLMGGLQGAAEYEAALVKAYPKYTESSRQAIKNMGPQTVAHLVIIAFIVIGNLAYFSSERAKPKLGVKS